VHEPTIKVRNGEYFQLYFVGRLSYQKGFDYLFEAVKQLYEEGYEITLNVIGTMEKQFEFIVDCEFVKFFGQIQQKDLFSEMQNAHALILPSVTMVNNEEQIGMVLLEAMASGVPTICTDVGGMPFVVSRDRSTLVIEERNIAAIKSAILDFYLNEEKRMSFAKYSFEYVKQNYSPLQISSQYKQFYEGLICTKS
jgi:glycosyltransferase involved in cell wall biosynthesis